MKKTYLIQGQVMGNIPVIRFVGFPFAASYVFRSFKPLTRRVPRGHPLVGLSGLEPVSYTHLSHLLWQAFPYLSPKRLRTLCCPNPGGITTCLLYTSSMASI